MSEAKVRAVALVIYVLTLLFVQASFVDSGLTPNENAIWLYSGIASLLFGNRILNPYFTPPSGALTNGVAALLAIVSALPLVIAWTTDAYVLGATIAFCALIALVSLLLLIFRAPLGTEPPVSWRVFERAVIGLGSPNVIFAILISAAVWLFHRDKPAEVFAILTSFLVITLFQPIEALAKYLMWFLDRPKPVNRADLIGSIAAHQSPGIVLVRQAEATTIAKGTPMVISDQHGPPQLGVALNYVGRDEGNLLRVLTTSLPNRLAALHDSQAQAVGGMAFSVVVTEEDKADIRALQWIDRLCGIVDTETSPDYLQFEVVNEAGLTEGSLVEARIGDHQSVIYQVVDGATRDEFVQQKNKYGYARAKGRKIGTWDNDGRRFSPVPWMPRMNAPVFLLEKFDGNPDDDCVGHFPATPYGVRLDTSACVTHNTAILGILGVGKSYLAIELVERMIAKGIKVVCLDLTNQYESLLEDFVDPAHEQARREALLAAGRGGAPHQNKEEGGSRHQFKQAVFRKMTEFMAADDDHFLWVINPAQFRVTKQVSGMYNNSADLAHLTPSEITAIFSDAALFVCQRMGMTDEARLCLVYEEAHSLVPEWNSVAAEGDKMATATSARAILQGRKYGLGCLLITQRTANVTKTILNQCNTIFAMRTFDDTGKDFLGNYIGSDYASILPSMQPRHAVVFGKASSCENPVLIRLNDQDTFRARFRPENPPKSPQPLPAAEAQEVGEAGTTDDCAEAAPEA
ncbi:MULTISPECIES: ATP-binding protein [unclassified Sphingopyxis]|uniref:ATP-binding protein n=1 Tax=unclassified Sphingopyxis TaxID=2614943 RepID=UPI0009E9C240|nr:MULTISPECIES: ATP-binding protein [unclassified Sphingopyxis]